MPEPLNQQRFFQALNIMGALFSDELTELRQRSYWQLFSECVTTEEWEYACQEAMKRETFHKVPLPAQLMDYVREHRRALRDAALQAQLAEDVRTRKRLLALGEPLVDPAEIEALITSVWPEEKETPKYPRLPTHRHLTEEELHYEPQTDPEEAKRKARAQLRQLLGEEG
jgi:hypothetical protein